MVEKTNFQSWQDELQYLLDNHNGVNVKGKIVNKKTREDRASYLFSFFSELRSNGYSVQPHNINQKHIKFICREYEKRNLAAATIQTYITHLRAFCQWIRKSGMIGDLSYFFSDEKFYRRSHGITETKELRIVNPLEIEIEEKFKLLRDKEPVVYLHLLLQVAFGLTRKEVIFLRPLMNVTDDHLIVVDGTRGRKVKMIRIESDFQKAVIEQAKIYVGLTSSTLTIKGKTTKQSIIYCRNVMTRFGITKKTLGISGRGVRSELATHFMKLTIDKGDDQ